MKEQPSDKQLDDFSSGIRTISKADGDKIMLDMRGMGYETCRVNKGEL